MRASCVLKGVCFLPCGLCKTVLRGRARRLLGRALARPARQELLGDPVEVAAVAGTAALGKNAVLLRQTLHRATDRRFRFANVNGELAQCRPASASLVDVAQ